MSVRAESKIEPKIRRLAEKWLPGFLIARLDPFQAHIDAEVAFVAAAASRDERILDAGAGESRHRRFFLEQRYIAVDSASGDPGWNYAALDVCGGLEHLPFKSATMDFVICMVVLEHVEEPGPALAEMARVLKPGGTLSMVVPFLWEEHQAPRDYFRFTRYGITRLLRDLPLDVTVLQPVGGFFQVCARRCINLMSFFQGGTGGWRWILFPFLAPFFGFLLPLFLNLLDGLDRSKSFSLGFQVRARRR